jgi:hypothetical protein
MRSWGDVSLYTQEEEEALLLGGVVQRARMQIGLFTVILTLTAIVIVMMVMYTLTLEKTHDLAVLKLMGAPRSRLLGLVVRPFRLLGGGDLCVVGHDLSSPSVHWAPIRPLLVSQSAGEFLTDASLPGICPNHRHLP